MPTTKPKILDTRTKMNGQVSRTKQSDFDKANINKIMDRYIKTGYLDHIRDGEGFYGDVSHIADFQYCVSKVNETNAIFNKIPSKIRAKFDNNPIKMLEFLSEETNIEEAIKLGLVLPNAEKNKEAAIKNKAAIESEKEIQNETPTPA